MSDRGSVVGSKKIYMFSDNHFSLKRCVERMKNEGHKNIVIDLFQYDGDFYRTAFETIKKVSQELNVGLLLTGVSKAAVDYNSFPYIVFADYY